jgi:hypothetical protein
VLCCAGTPSGTEPFSEIGGFEAVGQLLMNVHVGFSSFRLPLIRHEPADGDEAAPSSGQGLFGADVESRDGPTMH